MSAVQVRSRVGIAVWVSLAIVYIVWGSTYLAIRVVVEAGIPPLLGMGIRFVTAGLLLFGFVAVTKGPSALRIGRRSLIGTAIMGMALMLGGNGLVAVAEQTVPSGLTALLIGAVPLWFVLLRVSGGDRPRLLTWAGVLVGFAGIAAVSLPRGGIEGVEAWGVVVIMIASLSWAVGSYVSPRLHIPKDAMVSTAYEMLIGGVLLLAAGGSVGEVGDVDVASIGSDGWLAIGYLVTVGSLVGYTAYVYLLSHAPLSLVGTYAYVNPVVAVFLGWLILNEPVTGVVVAGGLLVVVGVAFVVRGERPRPVDPEFDVEREPALSRRS